jgi:hypothetical protein
MYISNNCPKSKIAQSGHPRLMGELRDRFGSVDIVGLRLPSDNETIIKNVKMM